MMTDQDPKQQYEGAILQQLIKNSERLAVVEKDIGGIKQELGDIKQEISGVKQAIDEIKDILGAAKWLLVTIAVGVLINIVSQPILSFIG